MRFLHSDIDYGPQISASAHLFDGPFKTGRTEIADTNFLLPFNPVVTELHRPPSAAFFGFNAYCAERDFPHREKRAEFRSVVSGLLHKVVQCHGNMEIRTWSSAPRTILLHKFCQTRSEAKSVHEGEVRR